MKFIISCLLTLQMLHIEFAYDWPSSSLEEDVNSRRTTNDNGRQPIALGYSGDLKKHKKHTLYKYNRNTVQKITVCVSNTVIHRSCINQNSSIYIPGNVC